MLASNSSWQMVNLFNLPNYWLCFRENGDLQIIWNGSIEHG